MKITRFWCSFDMFHDMFYLPATVHSGYLPAMLWIWWPMLRGPSKIETCPIWNVLVKTTNILWFSGLVAFSDGPVAGLLHRKCRWAHWLKWLCMNSTDITLQSWWRYARCVNSGLLCCMKLSSLLQHHLSSSTLIIRTRLILGQYILLPDLSAIYRSLPPDERHSRSHESDFTETHSWRRNKVHHEDDQENISFMSAV